MFFMGHIKLSKTHIKNKEPLPAGEAPDRHPGYGIKARN